MKKFIPVAESFFFAPEKHRVIQAVKIINGGNQVGGHSVIQCEHHPLMILFWCEHSDKDIVKSYPVKILNQPGAEIDYRDNIAIYHYTSDTVFKQANANVIKDCAEQINLFYAHVRPELVSNELLIVPEKSMEFLATIFKPK